MDDKPLLDDNVWMQVKRDAEERLNYYDHLPKRFRDLVKEYDISMPDLYRVLKFNTQDAVYDYVLQEIARYKKRINDEINRALGDKQ